MSTLLHRIHSFFFAPRSATSFGVMRICWAAAMLVRFLPQMLDIPRYYSNAGFLPPFLETLFLRAQLRFSLLTYVTTPTGVTLVYIALIIFLFLMLLGAYPRLSTILSVLLVFTFHERNPFPLAGGDTVLRTLGFILMISPGIEALSLQRARLQWTHWCETESLLPPLRMPAWPRRLLLWQLLVIYGMSLWSKLLGEMWYWGTVLSIAFHHPHFTRLSPWTAGILSWLSVPMSYSSLVYEGLWFLMLIPQRLFDRVVPILRSGRLRRGLIGMGLLFHLTIDFMLVVGIFLFAMTTALLGLLEEEDFVAIRRWCNRRWKGKIIVFFDGRCGLCRRSVFWIFLCDHLHRLRLVDYHNAAARKALAPDLKYADLDRAMHIRMPGGRTFVSFPAFRVLAWHIPLLRPIAPFLYLPGMAYIGEKVYKRISSRRVNCAHGDCAI